MKTTVREAEKGFLFRKGCYVKLLHAGAYRVGKHQELKIVPCADALTKHFDTATLRILLKDETFKSQVVVQDVPDKHVAVHMVDGHFQDVLTPGLHVYFTTVEQHDFTLYDIADETKLPEDLKIREACCRAGCMVRLEVPENKLGILFLNQAFAGTLEPGYYYYWVQNGEKRSLKYVETRRRQLNLNGQEILTKDKVDVRLNFVCDFQVTDGKNACLEIEDFEEQFRTAAQMTVREYVAGCTLDEILTQRERVGSQILELLQPKAEALYIQVWNAGIRDVILPGDVRNIMHTVLMAEKQAQANVITRREEVASTRSLLNTARLMDENRTLYKLKELEYLEKICENVGNISVSGGDLLSQLREIVGVTHQAEDKPEI